MAAPRGDQAGGGQEPAAGKQVAARRRVVAIGAPVAPAVDRPERPRLDVAEDLRPDLHALADRQGVGVRGGLLGARQDVQPAQDHLRPPLAIPAPPAHRPRSANVRWTVIPTTCGNGSQGGGPCNRFSSQYATSQSGGVAPAMLVSASDGVRTCLPKLACGSLG